MRINSDFLVTAFERTSQMEWVPSPALGVDRRMLDRVGGEVARATSLVRYAPASSFPAHTHGGGEEFLVLEGEFVDEYGRYPAGSYVRNPPGSSHAPASPMGCILFVKLHQFGPSDGQRVVVDTKRTSWRETGLPGVESLPLHAHGTERVALFRLAAGTCVPEHVHEGGEESFLLEGDVSDGRRHYIAGDWLRLPPGSRHEVCSESGCVLFVKSGHLPPGDLAQYE